nr:PREDICTED: enkurin domain-containing protein 1-like [Bemisia tabaci]XP_018912713.1 PREDICTED: enkurin domain-containing protein 1-like [Bemisia tabaci]XP_018914673.1 PREDICTED: enkurin domain-containing protein 1-like [Bemisia tabaci]XP_018914674.1 PREDICTED: enkurin domain-containing protein 1-like [Bemisia tabaci]XP_018914675.1 PREDICTED: enkurin domain-containing protein 1-like [Bemisia tabaci]XP_018914676.1 PREDICTED: enkurin domain-containing protein 1-like [Bemisia tabaci]
MSYPYKAPSMAEIFPLSYQQPKSSKNFIKENIRKVKGVKSKTSETGSRMSVDSSCKGFPPFKSAVRSRGEFGSQSFDSLRKPLIEKQKLTKHAEQLIEKTRSEICSKISSASTRKNYSDKECQTYEMENLRIGDQDKPASAASSARSIGLQTDILENINKTDNFRTAPSTKIKSPRSKKKNLCGVKSSDETLKTNRSSNNLPSKNSVPESYQRGTIPKYIQEKKLQKEQEEMEKKKMAQMLGTDDPDCPPGHVRLPDDKRKETLQLIKNKYDQLLLELNGLPVRSDSYRIKKHRTFLEKELEKMEAGLKTFSREKLFVKIAP